MGTNYSVTHGTGGPHTFGGDHLRYDTPKSAAPTEFYLLSAIQPSSESKVYSAFEFTPLAVFMPRRHT